ncbi:ead/Ea22-like family protein [Escherichia coli]|uniref:ead/Ea22-like family protein n=1 Tax=Escherichia coli TaxID=562 RepID=UPI000BE6A2AA|nr:ead/Ea22-like family protein [Escherichia coli]
MSKIDYQALREKAEKATCGVWSLEYGDGRFDGDDALIHREAAGYLPICRIEGAHPESGFDEDFQMEQQANAEFIAAANPATVLALLDELEGKDSKIANLTAERDALREGEMGDARHSNTRAAVDIYFQLVEECEIPAGGSLVEYVDDMREKLEAAENNLIDSECHVAELEEALRDKQALLEASEKRIAELEAELVSQTYKLNELSGNSPVTTDGWISCSERMPDTKTAVLVAREFDRKGDWRMKWATYIPGHPDANDGWVVPGASWIPSHWMPLPEPPQEVK